MEEVYFAKVNLREALAITPLLAAKSYKLYLQESEEMTYLAPIFDGLTEYEFVKEEKGRPLIPAAGLNPLTRRYLNAELVDAPAIPVVRLKEFEIKDGQQFVSKFERPYIFQSNSIHWRQSMSIHKEGAVLDALKPRRALRNVLSEYHPKGRPVSQITGVFDMIDFPIRAVASVFYAVGEYIGVDSANYELMLAVGGKAKVYVPPHTPEFYNHWQRHYRADSWQGQPIRVEYVSL